MKSVNHQSLHICIYTNTYQNKGHYNECTALDYTIKYVYTCMYVQYVYMHVCSFPYIVLGVDVCSSVDE